MNTIEHLLTCLMEEAAEIQQATSKSLRFGIKESYDDYRRYRDCVDLENAARVENHERLHDEICDLVGIIELLTDRGIDISSALFDREKIEAKKTKVEHFLTYARAAGTVTD